MISKKKQNILVKYLNNQASILEIEEIELWLNNEKNKKLFVEYVKVNYLIDLNLKKFNTSNSQKKLLEFIYQQKRIKRVRKIRVFSKYAAALVVFLGIFYFIKNDIVSEPTIEKIPEESITLKMSDGSVKVIDEKGNFKIKDKDGNELGTQNGNAIVYNDKIKIEKLVYNTLTVPYGKRFVVKLSDGTKVHLNAGTSLKYPVQFLKDKDRQVFIKTGEAYFDVVKDTKHPFIVNNNRVNIRVLGTQFNVSSYPEDSDISTVLVEGSVSLYSDIKSNKSIILKPGFKADWSKNDEIVNVEKVDIEMYTAWINGKIILKHMTFNSIIKKLERHYNVEIISTNKNLGKEYITATFDIETIEQVFEVINKIHPINYKITNNKITIN